ncbi:Actin-related protein 7 [Morella rubra]|uniref:Actin-related protein 7 n=1 Tax=Morella rubra TaxID=262757 RepID=A0A6A1WLU2_9ROSI|nr:Actin-related protein 7 [Morella rubra]
MEAAVVDAGSKLLKAGPAIPDQAPSMIIPTQMKRMLEDGSMADSAVSEDIAVEPVVRGFVRDWDAMEDLLNHVLYTGLGWEIGNEGQILFTDPLATPKVHDIDAPKGFEERFQKEASLSSSAIRPALVKPPEYMPENLTMYSAWVGGAILAKVVFPQNQHVTKAD